MSNHNNDMIDFICPVCGEMADERGCDNDCDIEEHIDALMSTSDEAWVPEDAAMEAGLFGWDC